MARFGLLGAHNTCNFVIFDDRQPIILFSEPVCPILRSNDVGTDDRRGAARTRRETIQPRRILTRSLQVGKINTIYDLIIHSFLSVYEYFIACWVIFHTLIVVCGFFSIFFFKTFCQEHKKCICVKLLGCRD